MIVNRSQLLAYMRKEDADKKKESFSSGVITKYHTYH